MPQCAEKQDFLAHWVRLSSAYGVLLYAEHDEDRKALLEYIKKGEDVDFEQVILNALWLSQRREENE